MRTAIEKIEGSHSSSSTGEMVGRINFTVSRHCRIEQYN